MQDVLLSIHSCSSAATNTLSQLTEKVTASYSTMEGHDNRMYRINVKHHLLWYAFYLQKKLIQ